MYYFCTYFDSNYLVKGLALYRSLVHHAKTFRFWVLCFDELAYEVLRELALPEVEPISLKEFEEGDLELLETKGNRSCIEYYFTCTPSLPLFVLRNHPEVDAITYLDADLFFFSDPSPIYRELDRGSVLIVEHRFPPHLRHREIYGIYNVGLLCFRRDDVALECLRWWRSRCLEWCYDRVEDARFADQKYLDDWPDRFSRVVVLEHKGAGLAPWNTGNYSLHWENHQVFVDSEPLLFFHFHGLKRLRPWLYDPNLRRYGARADLLLKRRVYGPYIRELEEVGRWISAFLPLDEARTGMGSIRGGNRETNLSGHPLRVMSRKIRNQLLQGDLLVVVAGRTV